MAKQEKSYSDWKDEGAHLTKEQWNAAGDFLLQGESSTNAIEMAEKLVLPPKRKEMCEFLSEDYAQRATNRGMDYKKSYESYMQRSQKRSFQELLEHFSSVKQFPTVSKSDRTKEEERLKAFGEYIITKNDDDCDDGVCKL